MINDIRKRMSPSLGSRLTEVSSYPWFDREEALRRTKLEEER